MIRHHDRLSKKMAFRMRELESNSQMRELCEIPGINLCSNDYLGLATDPRLAAAVIEGVEQCRKIAATGSRLLSGHDVVWEQLEQEFAAFAGTEASLFFNSGFAANTGLLSAVLGPDDLVFSDELNHASIIDGLRLSGAQKIIYPHGDLNFLEDSLRRRKSSGSQVIVTESIFSMNGDRAPLAEIFQLAATYGAEVIVDEAHATAACGPGGRGLLAAHGLEKQALASIHTCGKALASVGAFVCGRRLVKQFLINHSRPFIFSTALPPYLAWQIRAALRLAQTMNSEREHLSLLSIRLRKSMELLGYSTGSSSSHIVPLIVGGNEATLRFASALQEQGFAVRAIRAPSVPPGTERLRISLTAALTMGDLERFAGAICSLSSPGLAHA
ncbi:MAG TPA: 8-amino-7-oxononanoate synthase [Candidatus Angelobacter sp.]